MLNVFNAKRLATRPGPDPVDGGRPSRWRQALAGLSWIGRRFRIGRARRRECAPADDAAVGVVMIKIDGLSYNQIQRALANNRLPHLQRLIRKGTHRLEPFYSGVPSSTPVVQGELFYGLRTSVPGVSFVDRRRRKKVNMLFPDAAQEMGRHLERAGEPLLHGGTSYSNIYTGGAAEARYCTQTMTLRSWRHLVSSVKLVFLLLLQPLKLLRMAAFGLAEAGLAIVDFFRGVLQGRDVFKELTFVPTRVIVCILLRELIHIRVKMDVRRGMPIVHACFLAYDEQAHRRGPDSAFAHWTLKGIDAAIRSIHAAARRSTRRSYRLVLYSDHGQEAVVPFEARRGKTLQAAVTDAVADTDIAAWALSPGKEGRRNRLPGRRLGRLLNKNTRSQDGRGVRLLSSDAMWVAASGPLGHITFAPPLTVALKERLAQRLVRDGGVPLVLFVGETGVVAVNARGRFHLPARAADVLGGAHPFLHRAAADLAGTCRHAQAGDLVISGWTPDGAPQTFATESGAHGGPGRAETRGFVMLPGPVEIPAEAYRPADLRAWVFATLGRHGSNS